MNKNSLNIIVFSKNTLHLNLSTNILRQLGHNVTSVTPTQANELPPYDDNKEVDVMICEFNIEIMTELHCIEAAVQARPIRSMILSTSVEKSTLEIAKALLVKLEIFFLGQIDSLLQFGAIDKLIRAYLHTPIEKFQKKTPTKIIHSQTYPVLALSEIETTFQPIVIMTSQEIYGVEVLSRWNHPSFGLISPLIFIPFFEKLKMLDQLFLTQLNLGLELQKEHLDRGNRLNISFNLQPSQLSNHSFSAEVENILKAHGTTGEYITFELTESEPLEISATSIKNLIILNKMGIKISIDDFGVKHSSLRRFCQLPFNEIKIDSEFINMIDSNVRALAVIKSIQALSKASEIIVIVEGIETQQQHEQLMDLGFLYGQGYLYGAPMTKQEFSVWLKNRAHSIKAHKNIKN